MTEERPLGRGWGGPGGSFPEEVGSSAGEASLCFPGPAAGLFLAPGGSSPPQSTTPWISVDSREGRQATSADFVARSMSVENR
jgi:hypothetical protein